MVKKEEDEAEEEEEDAEAKKEQGKLIEVNVPEEVPGRLQPCWQLQEAVLGEYAPVHRPLRGLIPRSRLPLLHLHGVHFRHCSPLPFKNPTRRFGFDKWRVRIREVYIYMYVPVSVKAFQVLFIYTAEEESSA